MTQDEFRERLAKWRERVKPLERGTTPAPPAVREVPVPFNEKAEKDEEATNGDL